MPAITSNVQIQEGVSVFSYEGRQGYYVRVWNKAARAYRTKKIKGASTQQQALISFHKELEELANKPVKKKVYSDASKSMQDLIDEFQLYEEKRVMAGFKDDASHYRRKQSLRRLSDYLKLKEIEYPSQITNTTFDDYPLFRQGKMLGTIKSEVRDIGVLFRNYLQPRGYVSNELVTSRNFLPQITIPDEMLDANPAITPKDYELINKHIRHDWFKTYENHKGLYFRHYFWTFVHILKNSGARPKELLNVRFNDITLTNPKRWSESKQKWEDDYKLTIHIRKSKTGKRRDIVCRSNAGERMYKFLKFQQSYLANHTKVRPHGECLVFGKPDELFEKGYAYTLLGTTWRDKIIKPLKGKLEGNKFSTRPYSLYSCRSTFIEDCITDGLDVYLIARLCGNSVNIIQKVYDKHDILKRAGEIQAIDYGKQNPPEVETINPLGL